MAYKWGLWVYGPGKPWNWSRIQKYYRNVKPPVGLVADDFDLAWDLYEQANGQTNMIYRAVNDRFEKFWRNRSAEEWIRTFQSELDKHGERARKIRFQFLNEPQIDANWQTDPVGYQRDMRELMTMITRVMDATHDMGIQLSVGGWNIASYPYTAIFDWGVFDSLLSAHKKHKGWHRANVHHYGNHPGVSAALARIRAGHPKGFNPLDLLNPAAMVESMWPTEQECRELWGSNFHYHRGEWTFVHRALDVVGEIIETENGEGPLDWMPDQDVEPWHLKQRLAQMGIVPATPYKAFKGVVSWKPVWDRIHADIMAEKDGHEKIVVKIANWYTRTASPHEKGGVFYLVWPGHEWDVPWGMSVHKLPLVLDMLEDQYTSQPAPQPTPTPIPIPVPTPTPSRTTAPARGDGRYYETRAHTYGDNVPVYADKHTDSEVVGWFQAVNDDNRPTVQVIFISTKEDQPFIPFIFGGVHGWALKSHVKLDKAEPPFDIARSDKRFVRGTVKLIGVPSAPVRTHPSLGNNVIVSLSGGQQVDFIRLEDHTLLEQTYLTRATGVWVVVKTAAFIGVVDGDTVEMIPVVEPPAPTPTPTVEAILVINPEAIFRVRERPTIASNILGSLSPGQQVTILERAIDADGVEWLRIARQPKDNIGGVTGWVSAQGGKLRFIEVQTDDRLEAERQAHAQTRTRVEAAEAQAITLREQIAQVGLTFNTAITEQVLPATATADALVKVLEEV